MVTGWITIVLLSSAYCLHGSVFPDLPYSLDTHSKPSVHALCVVLYTLKGSCVPAPLPVPPPMPAPPTDIHPV
eukprot:11768126-Ditylum_brightwellii.AAC.1